MVRLTLGVLWQGQVTGQQHREHMVGGVCAADEVCDPIVYGRSGWLDGGRG